MAPPKKQTTELSETKIRQVIWMLKVGKTKKQCCEHLGIAYNTKRLDKIVEDFKAKETRDKQLKEKNKNSELSKGIIDSIINSYLDKEAVQTIADRFYIPATRIKKILTENNIPLRSRGKKIGNADHIIQDYDIKLNKGDKVFIPGRPEEEFISKTKAMVQVKNVYGIIYQVFDEDYIEFLKDGYSKAIYLRDRTPKEDQDYREGIDYEVYWYLSDGKQWGKLEALERHLARVEKHLVDTGREFYRVWLDDKVGGQTYSGFYDLSREQLVPIEKR